MPKSITSTNSNHSTELSHWRPTKRRPEPSQPLGRKARPHLWEEGEEDSFDAQTYMGSSSLPNNPPLRANPRGVDGAQP